MLMKIAAVLSVMAVTALSSGTAAYGKGAKADTDGHELVSLWKEYGRLQDEDRPDKEEEVLERIISQAERRHLPWDFYDAWREYRDAVLSRDWKRREAVDSALMESVRKFDEPVVTYAVACNVLYADTDLAVIKESLKEDSARLKSSRNGMFYREGYSTVMSSVAGRLPESVIKDIANDYEYILWSMLFRSQGKDAEIPDMLSESLSGRYPSAPYMEYRMSAYKDRGGRQEALESIAEKYSGKAVSCYAVQDLFSLRMEDMLSGKSSCGSVDFLEFRRECADFEKMRKGFSGSEKEIAQECTLVKGIIARLDAESIRLESRGDTVLVLLRNIGSCRLEILPDAGKDAVPVFAADPLDSKGSYYVTDTVRVLVPDMDDGTYLLKCSAGKTFSSADYVRNRISVAYRKAEGGIAVFAADMESGRPLEKADVEFFLGDSLVCSFGDVSFTGGFTPFHADFTDGIEKNGRIYSLKCSFRDGNGRLHSSGKTGIDYRVFRRYGNHDNGVRAEIFKDRAVYDFGDTLRFKAVLYRPSDTATGLETLPAGETVKAVLTGPGNAVSDTLVMASNEFGSVSGSFIIPDKGLGGRYMLDIRYADGTVASSSLVAGAIDTPTFDLEFDRDSLLHFPGDSITVSGTVSSYTGHQLSSASLSWKVTGTAAPLEGTSAIGSDGRFSFSFRDSAVLSSSYSYYSIAVTVTDLTGETYRFHKGLTAAPRLFLDMEMTDAPEAMVTPSSPWNYSPVSGYGISMVGDEPVQLAFTVRNSDYQPVNSVPVRYSLYHGNELLQAGEAVSCDTLDIDLSGRESGLYRLEAEASAAMKLENGEDSLIVYGYTYDLIKTAESDTVLNSDVENLFKVIRDGDITLQIGTGNGPMWAVAELWGEGDSPLRTGLVYLDGEKGRPGSITTLRYSYEDSYPDDVRLVVLYFRDGKDYRYSADYHREAAGLDLPVAFSSFTAGAGPGEEVTMTLKTVPDAEAVISVFDIGTERIMPNFWNAVYRRMYVPDVRIQTDNGFVGCRRMLFRGGANGFMAAKAAVPESDATASDGMTLEEDEAVSSGTQSSGNAGIRSDFANTLAFIPFARPEADSTLTFSFRTSDKLSTYEVSVFSHDRTMRNNAVSRNMTVTKPVMVSVLQPRFLREGDRYVLSASVANGTPENISGVLEMFVYDSEDYEGSVPLLVKSLPVGVAAGGASPADFSLEVPEGLDVIGFKIVYEGVPESCCMKDGSEGVCWSDGVFVTVPVLPDTQILTETHSAALLPGMSADSLKAELSGQFVNTLPYGAETREISLLDMVKSAIPLKSELKGKDAVSVSDALFVRMLSGCAYGQCVDSLVARLLDCRNGDGGFAWFSGMESSPAVTALVLERAAGIYGRTHVRIFTAGQEENALSYLDKAVFSSDPAVLFPEKTVWTAGISLPEYLYVRSMYPSVPAVPAADSGLSGKERKALLKAVKSWLVSPTGSEGFEGRLIDKARRASVIMNLIKDGEDAAFAESLGIGRSFIKKLSRTLRADIRSLCSYSVEHGSGGMYFPNAVMPFRGLLDSELYAHSLICDVLGGYASDRSRSSSGQDDASVACAVADGVRLWMMIQKETQQWENDPAFVRAMASVLDGSPDVLATRIVVMSKRYEKPFDDIMASGNGFEVDRQFLASRSGGSAGVSDGLSVLHAGDSLSIGDRIVCRYTVKSGDNRSFVKLTVPRYASFRPVDQVSGMTGWWRSPLPSGRRPGVGSYRNVLDDRTEYYFDVLPEGVTVIDEVFYLSQDGVYQSPVPEVECMYAPHYRANAGASQYPLR